MARKAGVLKAHLRLPHELYRDIIENLHHVRDKRTLLRLARVSKVWCAESQPVLFRTVGNTFTDTHEYESFIRTHTLFLQAIIHNPTRLGPYVQAYKQCELICHPFLTTGSTASSHLWDLTAEALPAFVNLKHLFLVPKYGDSRTPRVSLLDGCTFKLESLRWGFKSFDPSSTDPLVVFLRTQYDLLHLEVGCHPLEQEFSWLPDDICPSLVSATCRLNCAPRVMAKPRNVAGLQIWTDWYPHQMTSQSYLSEFRRLKYMSLWAHHDFLSICGTTDDMDAVLLELISWDLGTVQSLSNLPNLRVLALLRAPREERFARYSHVDGTAEYSLRMQIAIESFRQCPKLEYIVVEDMAMGQGPRRYNKLSIPRINGVPGAEQEIQSEEFSVEHKLGMPWWTVYGV